MKQVGGVWLPDHEVHLVEWMTKMNQKDAQGRLTYQHDKREMALAHVKNWRTAVDVGSHCGLWSMQLDKRFAHIEAFEPVAAHCECFLANLADSFRAGPEGDVPGFTLHACALGETACEVGMTTKNGSSGDSFVADSPGDIPMRRLDEFDLQDVDFIKLDCEGYELLALKGGEETLKRCRPCVIVEQKPPRPKMFGLPDKGAVDYLISLGAKLRAERSGDYVLSFD